MNIPILFLFPVTMDLLFSCLVVVVHGPYTAMDTVRVHDRADGRVRTGSVHVRVHGPCPSPCMGRVHGRAVCTYGRAWRWMAMYTRAWPCTPCTQSCTWLVGTTRPCTRSCSCTRHVHIAYAVYMAMHTARIQPCTRPSTRLCTRSIQAVFTAVYGPCTRRVHGRVHVYTARTQP